MSNHIRVKLLFNNCEVEPSWFSVNFEKCKTIADVEERIWSKFDTKTREIKLMLADCRLPSWESVRLLREGDILHVANDLGERKHHDQQRVMDTSKISNGFANPISDDLCDKESMDVSQDFRGPEQGNADTCDTNKNKSSPKQNDSDELNLTVQLDGGPGPKKRKRKRKKRHLDMESGLEQPARDQPVKDTPAKNPEFVQLIREAPAGDLFVINLPVKQRDGSNGSQKNRHITFSEEEVSGQDHQTPQPPAPEVTQSQYQEYLPFVEERSLPSGVPVYSRLKKKSKAFHRSQPENGHGDIVVSPGKEDHAIGKSVLDFNQLPDFQGLPCEGDKIAFRMLELSERHSPEFSKFKVAVVKSYDPISTIVELQWLNPSAENDLEKDSASLETTEDGVTSEQWSSLIQVKLVT